MHSALLKQSTPLLVHSATYSRAPELLHASVRTALRNTALYGAQPPVHDPATAVPERNKLHRFGFIASECCGHRRRSWSPDDRSGFGRREDEGTAERRESRSHTRGKGGGVPETPWNGMVYFTTCRTMHMIPERPSLLRHRHPVM